MSTEKCFDVADQLAAMGSEVITLSGGEPTMNPAWDQIASRLTAKGVYVNMITNGVYRDEAATREVARRALAAGMGNIGVSIDGPPEIHDGIRGQKTFAKTMKSIEIFKEEGLKVAVLTTVSKLNLNALRELKALLVDAGVRIWRLQLGLPMGVMDEGFVLDPPQLLQLMPALAKMKREGGLELMIADTLGYYGHYDSQLRGERKLLRRKSSWQGCQAGRHVLGIEASGNIKGCLSMLGLPRRGWTVLSRATSMKPASKSCGIAPAPLPITASCSSVSSPATAKIAATLPFVAVALAASPRPPRAWSPKISIAPRAWRANTSSAARAALYSRRPPAAAAALLFGVVPAGCDDDSEPAYGVPEDIQEDDSQNEELQPAYGVPLDLEEDEQDIYEVAPAYGLPEDIQEDESIDAAYGVPEDMQTAYGVPEDFQEEDIQGRVWSP